MAIAIKWYGNDILKKIDKQNIDLIRCIARTISRTAKQLCPVKTSTLRRSIRAVVTKDIAKVQAGGTWLVGGVATPVEYAGYVELGTSKMAAQPYLRPAVEQFSKMDLDECISFIKLKEK